MVRKQRNLPWFKFPASLVEDPEVWRLSGNAFKIVVGALALASTTGSDVGLDPDQLAWKLRINDIASVEEAVSSGALSITDAGTVSVDFSHPAFDGLGLSACSENSSTSQFSAPSSSTERVRRYRAKKATETSAPSQNITNNIKQSTSPDQSHVTHETHETHDETLHVTHETRDETLHVTHETHDETVSETRHIRERKEIEREREIEKKEKKETSSSCSASSIGAIAPMDCVSGSSPFSSFHDSSSPSMTETDPTTLRTSMTIDSTIKDPMPRPQSQSDDMLLDGSMLDNILPFPGHQKPVDNVLSSPPGDTIPLALEVKNEGVQAKPEKAVIPSQSRSPHRLTAMNIFTYWREQSSHTRAAFDTKREKAITGRLKEGYSEEDLKMAVDGCMSSPFHQGENKSSRKYDDIELICRDATHVDQFIAVAAENLKNPRLKGESAYGRRFEKASESFLDGSWINLLDDNVDDKTINGECNHVG